jgi:hypothetical protein
MDLHISNTAKSDAMTASIPWFLHSEMILRAKLHIIIKHYSIERKIGFDMMLFANLGYFCDVFYGDSWNRFVRILSCSTPKYMASAPPRMAACKDSKDPTGESNKGFL